MVKTGFLGHSILKNILYVCQGKLDVIIIIIIIICYIYIALFWALQSALHSKGISPHPPPVCSIHLDDATAAIVRQNPHHTPAYWWRGDIDEANQCMGMIRRP